MTTYIKISKTDLPDGALYDKVNDIADALNSTKLESSQIGSRQPNTDYSVGTIRYCDYHPEFFLKCTTSGTTGVGALDTSGTITLGQIITDGSVVWRVVDVSPLKTVNGISPDGNGNVEVGTVKKVNNVPPDSAGNVNVGKITITYWN